MLSSILEAVTQACSSLHVAMVVASTHVPAIPACSIAMSLIVAEFVCPL